MKIYNFLIPLLIFGFGMANCGKDLFGIGFDQYPGDLADTRFNNVILEHDYQWLIGNQASLWDVPFFYPAPNMLAGSDNHLGTFLLYAPFRLLGFNETHSFQFWVFCLLTLNFFVFYKVARQFGLSAAASACGAFLFTFSMPVLGSINHLQTLCKFSFPLVIWFFYKILFIEQKKNILWFGLSLAHVFYSSLYYGMFTVLILLVFFLVSLFKHHRLKTFFSRENLVWISSTVVLLFLLMWPLLSHYSEQAKFAPEYSMDQLMPLIPHPYSYLMPHAGTIFHTFIFKKASEHTSMYWGHYFFIGLVSLILLFSVVYFLRKDRKSPHHVFFGVSGWTLFIMLLLTSAVGPYTLYKYLANIDAFNHLKMVNRVVLIELFFIGILVAYSIDKINITGKKGMVMTAILALLVCGEHWIEKNALNHLDIDKVQNRHLYINKAIENNTGGQNIFVVQSKTPCDVPVQVDAMMAALQTQKKTLNGYTTVVDAAFYHVCVGPRKNIATWLFHSRVDTTQMDKTILFIPEP